MTGTCSECGLEFHWRDVLNPEFTFPRWCVEFGLVSSYLLRTFRTLFMMVRPWWFWRDLQMHHRPQWRRIALFVLLVMVPLCYLPFAASVGYATWRAARWSATIAPRPSPPWVDGLRAAVFPFTDVSFTASGPMPSSVVSRDRPLNIFERGWRDIRLGIVRMPWDSSIDALAPRGFALMASILFCPVGFALLPISRRIARVRWQHLLRITLYSLLISLVPLGADTYHQIERFTPRYAYATSVLATAIIVIWWSFATSRYLRIRHSWAVAVYVVAFGYLVGRLILESIDFLIELVA